MTTEKSLLYLKNLHALEIPCYNALQEQLNVGQIGAALMSREFVVRMANIVAQTVTSKCKFQYLSL